MPYLGVKPADEFTSKDLNGEQLILDADADTTITADTDDQIDIRIAGADDFQFTANKFLVQTGSNLDMNGTELILDADADTSITADTDDQIDIRIAGADDFQFTANTFTAQSGSTITTPTLGVITAHDLGAGIHVRTSDTGGSVSANSDELVLEGDGNAGLTLLSKNDSVGQISFGDGDATQPGIIQYAHGTNRLEFYTNGTKHMQINSDADVEISAGNLLFKTASKGVYLGTTSAVAANLLDDYEEGTFTPTLVAAGGSGTIAYSFQAGRYIKIGSLCYVSIRLITTSTSSRSGNASIAGLPFTANAANSSEAYLGHGGGFTITAGTNVSGHTGNGSATITLYNWDVATGASIMQISEWTNDGDAMLNMVYDI